jgi:predicted RNA polymerase sigma factor
VRARQLIRDLRLPFAVPDASELPQRLDGVLAALYLLFNEGYKASSGDRIIREELCHEAIRLTRLLGEHPATSQPATKALLALMCLNAARLRARVNPRAKSCACIIRIAASGMPDSSKKASSPSARPPRAKSISPYHLEAGIAACHCLAPDEASTDWPRILSLYDQLLLLKPTPIVAMNRSVALARVRGPREALEALESIPNRHSLEAQHLYHAIRASFIAKLGHPPKPAPPTNAPPISRPAMPSATSCKARRATAQKPDSFGQFVLNGGDVVQVFIDRCRLRRGRRPSSRCA